MITDSEKRYPLSTIRYHLSAQTTQTACRPRTRSFLGSAKARTRFRQGKSRGCRDASLFLSCCHVRFAHSKTASSEYLCDLTTGICGESPSERSIRRTELAARLTWKTRRIRSATIFEVHRSTGRVTIIWPAATMPLRMISLSCCFCTSLSFGWRPEPFFVRGRGVRRRIA